MSADARHTTKLYDKLAHWWHLFSSPDDYREEADFFRRTLIDNCHPSPKTVLKLGSGGGNNASHLKAYLAEKFGSD